MNAKYIIPILAMVLVTSSVFALDTMVQGKVYSGNSDLTPVVVGANVDVTCWHSDATKTLSDTTNSEGYYEVLFDADDCQMGDDVQSCVGSVCSDKTKVQDELEQVNIVGVDIFNVPEFTAVAMGVALAGGILGFMYLRKR
jgi:hypothetical protein